MLKHEKQRLLLALQTGSLLNRTGVVLIEESGPEVLRRVAGAGPKQYTVLVRTGQSGGAQLSGQVGRQLTRLGIPAGRHGCRFV